ncbi:MAG: hypothetical protein E6R03_00755, partial [Hyphomicrobiaceae bacterium]
MSSQPIASLFVDFRAGTISFEKDMRSLAKTLNRQAKDFAKLGEGISKALTVPITAGAVAAFKAADNYQKAQKILQVSTGKTGEALKGLQKDFEAVAGVVPNAFSETAKAMSDVQVRTGKTGESAQELTKQFLELSNVTETDLNANLDAGLTLFDAWGIEVDKQSPLLDKFYRASQLSGKSVAELMSTVGGSDAILGAFGFSIEESIGLVTNFARGGVDAEKTFASLNKAFLKWADAGKDPRQALLDLLQAIEQMPFSTEVAARAAEVFGKKVAIDMVDAAQEGRFNYNQYLDTINNGNNTILGAAQANRTFGEAVAQAWNTINLAIGQGIDPSAYKELNETIKELGESIAGVINWFFALPEPVRNVAIATTALAAVTGPVLIYFGWILESGAVVAKTIGTIAKATGEWAAANAFLNSTFVSGVIGKIVAAFSLLGALALPIGALAIAIVGLAAGTAAFGGDFLETIGLLGKFFYTGFVEVIKKGIELIKAAFFGVASFIGTVMEEAAVRMLQMFGLSENMARSVVGLVKTLLSGLVAAFKAAFESIKNFAAETIDAISGFFERGFANWRRGLLVIKYGGVAAAAASEEYKALEASLASAGKTAAEAGQQVAAVGGLFTDIGSYASSSLEAVNTKIRKLPPSLKETEDAAKKAADALKDMRDQIGDIEQQHGLDTIKEQIEEIAKGGSAVDFKGKFETLESAIADSYYEGFTKANEKATDEQLEQARGLAEERAAIEGKIYREQISKQQLEADKEKHKKSVDFFKGLMEDMITGTRFDWVEQFKKAAVEIAAEWATRLLEANILGAQSMGQAFDIVISSLTGALDSWFGGVSDLLGGVGGSLFGGGTAGAGGVITDPAGNAVGSAVGGAAAGAAPTTVGGYSLASLGGIAAAAAVGYIVTKTNFDNITGWDSQTRNEKIGFDIGTGILDVVAPGIGTAINKIGGSFGLFGGSKLSKNQQSLKAFEGWVEDTLKKSLGTALNFVVGDIGQFDKAGWANDFWKQFGERGADTFSTLGVAFEEILGLEEGVGGQIGALLAQNLAGMTGEESLDNIKLFLDSVGVSVADLNESILQMGLSGNLTWHEFESMRQSLEQIPAVGLAAFGDISGALDQVLQSGGRGIQAIQGLRNIAVEAGEKGVTSFEQLRTYLLDAGYSAETVGALFQAFSARGITSFEELSGAADPVLGGVIADMQTLGVKWEDFATDSQKLEGSVKNLASSIRDLAR